MTKYIVDVVQSRWAYSQVEVEAESEDAARDAVHVMLADVEEATKMFEKVDFNDFGWVNDETRISWVTPAEEVEALSDSVV